MVRKNTVNCQQERMSRKLTFKVSSHHRHLVLAECPSEHWRKVGSCKEKENNNSLIKLKMLLKVSLAYFIH